MRAARRFFVLLLTIPVLPAAASAQGADCYIVDSGTMNIFNGNTPQELVFIGGGARFRCPNGTTIASDSVARYTGQGLIEFIGHVRYTDPENILTAGYVRYIEPERYAIAQTNVVLTDRRTGSVIRGPLLNYYQAGQGREEALIRIPSGRPHAILVSIAEADSTRRDSTIVDADRMDIRGRDRFDAWGNVELTRGDLVGVGDEISYDRAGGSLRLALDARLTSDDYVLLGDTVRGRTNEADEIEQLTAIGEGRLEGREVTVEAPTIRLFFEAGEVQRMVAVANAQTDEEAPLDPFNVAVATSADFRLTADSIDAVAPMQELEQVTAVGHAYGERIAGEIADATVPTIASRDWMRGDTVIALFAAADTVEVPDSTARRRVEVDRVIAVGVGDRARSTYRVRDEADPEAEPGINYLLARRITIQLKEGGVEAVQADGEVQGMYLQPTRQPGTATGNGRGGRR